MQSPHEFVSTGSITTKYHGPTNSRGSRVSARRSEKRPGDKVVYVSWDHSVDAIVNHARAALEFMDRESIGATLSTSAYWTDGGYVFGFDWEKEAKS